MAPNVVDKKDLLVQVIRAVQPVRRAHKDETPEQWSREIEAPLQVARDLLGAYGEGKALTEVIALCTQLLEWHDLSEVGVQPTSSGPSVVAPMVVKPTVPSEIASASAHASFSSGFGSRSTPA